MRRSLAIAILTTAGCLACGPAVAQYANPVINGLEIAPAGSLEWDILDRLYTMNRYDPRDLFRLSRMTVLESIAMYENMRADAPGTLAGALREGEMSYLWDAAELFYVAVTPSTPSSLVRARPLLADVELAYARLAMTLGNMPALSNQAALHLQNVARMLPVMNALIDAMERDEGIPVGVPAVPAPPLSVGVLRERIRGLIDDLRGFEQSLKTANAKPGPEPLIAELDGLIDLVVGLDRLLAIGAPSADFFDRLRLVRTRLWVIQARFPGLSTTFVLAARWRSIRDRINGLSDVLGRPRIVSGNPPAAAAMPAAAVDRRLLAQADRAVAAMDEFVERTLAGAPEAAGGSQYRERLGRLRRRLSLFREEVAAGQSVETLRRSLEEVQELNRGLAGRAQAESRIYRGDSRVDAGALRDANRAVGEIHILLPEGGATPVKPRPVPPGRP